MQTRWPGGSIAMLYGPPIAPVIEPLHNSLHEARRATPLIPTAHHLTSESLRRK